jgi:hypothetical protein
MMAATGGSLGLAAPVLIYLGLGDRFCESLSVSPMDMDVGDDLILGWDWISSHDLRHLYTEGCVSLRSWPAQLQLALLPASTRASTRTLTVIGHGEFRRLLRHVERGTLAVLDAPLVPTTAPRPPAPTCRSPGWSLPVHADHAELLAVAAAALQAARARRRPGRQPEPGYAGLFADGVEVLRDGTVLHLASFCLADAELHLADTND